MKTFLLKSLLLTFSVCIALLLLEGALRLLKPAPTPRFGYHVYRWAKQDDRLGWRMRPGVWPVDVFGLPMTIQENGTRVTGSSPGEEPLILVVGGSYALGYGVRDHETLTAHLQALLPHARVVNAAVPGYGTYQSYLYTRTWVEEHPEARPDIVVYGFCEHHILRNTPDVDWLRALRTYSGEQIVHPHLVATGPESWKEQAPQTINLLGLADNFLLIKRLQGFWIRHRFPSLELGEHRAATVESLRLFAGWCKEQDIRLVVANMFCQDCGWLEAACRKRGIEYLDVAPDVYWKQKGWFLIKDGRSSGHPNARFQEYVARKLAKGL